MNQFFELKLLKQVGDSSTSMSVSVDLEDSKCDKFSIYQLLRMEKSEVGIQIFQLTENNNKKFV